MRHVLVARVPEGHTIHRAARVQAALLVGKSVHVDSPQGRFLDAAIVDGATLARIDAYGKHLLYDFGDDRFLHVHLGLFGRFRSGIGPAPEPRPTTRARLVSALGWVMLSGPTACEVLTGAQRRMLLARLGPDPIRSDARPAPMIARIGRSTTPIGALLMDQSVVSGIGNVYRAEILFRARLNPWVVGKEVDGAHVRALWKDARTLLRDGEQSGRIVTTGNRRRGFQYYVYHRAGKPCRVCGTTIRSAPMAARTVYWCPQCQPS